MLPDTFSVVKKVELLKLPSALNLKSWKEVDPKQSPSGTLSLVNVAAVLQKLPGPAGDPDVPVKRGWGVGQLKVVPTAYIRFPLR